MKLFRWQKDRNKDLVTYASNGNVRICLRVHPDGEYEGQLLRYNSPHLSALNNQPIKVFGNKAESVTKAILRAEQDYCNYMKIPYPKKPVPIKIEVADTDTGYELKTNLDVDELKYYKNNNKKASIYKSKLPKGNKYKAVATLQGKVVAELEFGEDNGENE